MNGVLPNARSLTHTVGMDLGWGSDAYAAPYGMLEPATTSLHMPFKGVDEESSFAHAMSAFTNQEPTDPSISFAAPTVNPLNMWPDPDPSTTPSISTRHDSAPSISGTPKISQNKSTIYSNFGTPRIPQFKSTELPPSEQESFSAESTTTSRARYAANQRHRKARALDEASSSKTTPHSSSNIGITSNPTNANEKQRRLREKNKVAAAKCRQRQRRQAETIQQKGGRLGEENAQLKSYVQELRRELNGLRALALGHGDCDGRLARYNQVQAERVMAEYYSAYRGQAAAVMVSE